MKSFLVGFKMQLDAFQQGIWRELGFSNFNDFITSSFNTKLLLFSSNIILIIATGTQMFSEALGLKPQILLGFTGLIVLEFWTGRRAAIKEGNHDVDKMTRVFTKLAVYGCLLFILNSMTGVESFTIWGFTISLFDYLFWIFFCGISFKLAISIFGNLDRMGFEEASVVHKVLHGKLQLFIAFDKKKTQQLFDKLQDEQPKSDETKED